MSIRKYTKNIEYHEKIVQLRNTHKASVTLFMDRAGFDDYKVFYEEILHREEVKRQLQNLCYDLRPADIHHFFIGKYKYQRASAYLSTIYMESNRIMIDTRLHERNIKLLKFMKERNKQ